MTRSRSCTAHCEHVNSDELDDKKSCNLVACGVLVLNTYDANSVPLVIGYNGEFDSDINFTYEANTHVYLSCAATLNNEMWILGGHQKRGWQRQMSKVTGCTLKNVGNLDFDYSAGGCNTFDSMGILLCFSESGTESGKTCRSFNGDNNGATTIEASSIFPHFYVMALGSYKNLPFVTGSDRVVNGVRPAITFGLKTEILENGVWVDQAADYPFSSGDRISDYSTTSTSEAIFIIGGFTNFATPGTQPVHNRYTTTIAKYQDKIWTNVGNLKVGRHIHSSITMGSKVMIVGGWTVHLQTGETELWESESPQSQIINSKKLFNNRYPALFHVDLGFCSKN